MTNEYLCPTCGKHFYGRSNKIFCSSHCRAVYNNSKKAYQQTDKAETIEREEEKEEVYTGSKSTKLTIITDNKVVLNVIKQICLNNDIKIKSEEVDNLPLLTPDKNGRFYMNGKILYTASMIAGMINADSKTLAIKASHIKVYPVARGPIPHCAKANLFTEDDAFKIMERFSKK